MEKPAQRDQVSLNGLWEEGGAVPVYGGEILAAKQYRRCVDVPSAWSGKRIQLEFEAVNFSAEIFIDGKSVGHHAGAWLPFALDVTEHVKAGQSFTLTVSVQGMLAPPMVDENDRALWPIGTYYLDNRSGGIADDVWLRAYGAVCVVDAFIRPSVREKLLRIDYTLRNTTAEARNVELVPRIEPGSDSDHAVPLLPPKKVSLAAGEIKTVTVENQWSDPVLWWPDHPYLYLLQTEIRESEKVVDRETRRFGFREIGSEGNQFRLNGVRLNLRGEYTTFGDPWFWPMDAYRPEKIAATYAILRERLNENVVRWHRYPPPRYALDAADETGMLLVAESPLYGQQHYMGPHNEVVRNTQAWLEQWVRTSRNHPSIIMWSTSNEVGLKYRNFGAFTREDLAALYGTVLQNDPTRPITQHGDAEADAGTNNLHYPAPKGSVYNWSSLVQPDRPTILGEVLNPWTPRPNTRKDYEQNRWLMGQWLRGARYVNFADVRPTLYQWASKEMDAERVSLIAHAYAPVALFDKAYDDHGPAPFQSGQWPQLPAGQVARRTLVLYNDEFLGTRVQARVTIRAADLSPVTMTQDYEIGLGEHMDIPCEFSVPADVPEFSLVLETRKEGVKRFEEVRRFRVVDAQPSRANPDAAPNWGLRLGEAQQPTHVPPAGLEGSAVDHAVTLKWKVAAGAQSYVIQRSKAERGTLATIAQGVTQVEFTDHDVTPGTTYYYAVAALNPPLTPAGAVETGASKRIKVQTTGAAPAPGLAVAAMSTRVPLGSGERMQARWTSIGNVGPVAVDFSTDGGATWQVMTASTEDDGVEVLFVPDTPSRNCRLRVRQVKGAATDMTPVDFQIGASRVAGDDILGAQLQPEGVTSAQEFKKWHKITVTFNGPYTSEREVPNPFRDYRLDVTFSKGDRQITVPGYYAADGMAAKTGASSGRKWRAHFVPAEEGEWTYRASFRTGQDVAMSVDPRAGTPLAFDGEEGVFVIGPTDKHAPDFRAKGMLRYVGERYPRFAETGEYFIKGGTDSPETFLNYYGFDGAGPKTKRYLAHANDWVEGDPSWQYDRGRNIIGALNYLGSKGVNSVYFLTNCIHPDATSNVSPWADPAVFDRYDCSKLDQWEIVFQHMDHLGIMLHLVMQERQNDQMLDNGELGPTRRLYHRELVARFAHHLALQWNLGEENGAIASRIAKDHVKYPRIAFKTDAELDGLRKAFAAQLRAIDPYDHPIVVHAYPKQKEQVFRPLVGYADFEGPSLQHPSHAEIVSWIDASAQAGRPWLVCLDESGNPEGTPPGGYKPDAGSTGVAPDSISPNHDGPRQIDLWPTLLAGAAGVEWYFGHQYPQNDSSCEDWRTRDHMWDQTRYAVDFFHRYLPFTRMRHADELSLTKGTFCFALPGEIYAVYLPKGGSTEILFEAGTYVIDWYNPRTGVALAKGTVQVVDGPNAKSIGLPPSEQDNDWVVLVRRVP